MKINKILSIAALLAAFTCHVYAQDAAGEAKPAEQAVGEVKQEQKAAPAVDEAAVNARVEALLAWIPDVAAQAKGGVKVNGKDIKEILGPQLKNAFMGGVGLDAIKENDIRTASFNTARALLTRTLILNEAVAKGFKKDKVAAGKKFDELKAQVGDEKQFAKLLKDYNETAEGLKERIAEDLAIDAYVQSMATVTDEEVAKFYNDNPGLFKLMHASHILAKFPGVDERRESTEEEKAECMKKIQAAKQELDGGKDFAEVARAMSDCPSKEQGGSLGGFQEGDMVPEFDEALKKLVPGQISDPVESRFGYHIIRLEEPEVKKLEEVKDLIKKDLQAAKANKMFRERCEKLFKEQGGKISFELPKQPKPLLEPVEK